MPLTPLHRKILAAEYSQLASEVATRSEVPKGAPPQTQPSQDALQLRRPPVWLASVDKIPVEGVTSRSHSFVAVGDPGRRNKSGVGYYSVSGDEKRGGIDVDAEFLRRVDARSESGAFRFDPRVRAAVAHLSASSYPSKEAFYLDYKRVRAAACPGIRDEKIAEEVGRLCMLAPAEKMEMWLREPNGKDSRKPNLAERDVRSFENVSGVEEFTGKDFSRLSDAEKLSGNVLQCEDISLRHLPNADPIALLEVKRAHYLQRLYMDELHGRNGTGIPVARTDARTVAPEHLRQATLATPTYQKAPPFPSDRQGNCTTGAASILRQANNREEDIKTASAFAFGLHQGLRAWAPVKSQQEQVSRVTRGDAIDPRPIRGNPIDVTGLNRVLRSRALALAAMSGSRPTPLKAKL